MHGSHCATAWLRQILKNNNNGNNNNKLRQIGQEAVQSKILDVVLDKYDPVFANSSYGLFVKFIRVSSFFCQME